jgi:hypothetical protein
MIALTLRRAPTLRLSPLCGTTRGEAADMDLYLQFEHGEELRSIAFEGRIRLRVDFNAIGPVVMVEPVDGAVVIEAEVRLAPETELSEAG